MTLIIGFGHKARQGKGVAALAISDYYNGQRDTQQLYDLPLTSPLVQHIGFADALYEVCRNEYGMTTKDAPLLQRVGHERRQADPEYWIKRAFARIGPRTDIVVISDLRYQNEAAAIKAKGGYIVDVARVKDNDQLLATDRPADHPSEVDLDGYSFDFFLVNVEGHEALLAQQAVCLAEYLRGLHN